MHKIPLSLLVFAALVSPTPSSAQAQFCAALKTVLDDAGNHFVSLRGQFDFDIDQYTGTLPIGQLRECATESGDGVASYQCQLGDLPDSEAHAANFLARLDQDVRACFGQDLRRREARNNRIRYEYLPTGDDIRLRYSRIEPRGRGRSPFYYLGLEVTFIEVSQ